MRGKFITIEGQDGAGKTTNVDVIKRCLDSANIDYVHSREPGGTDLGEIIRKLLLSSSDSAIGDTAELLLIFAARAQHIEERIEPALDKGQWVLCDRFTDATYAYQGAGRGMSMADIQLLENYVQSNLRPDLTVLLDLPVSLGESRAGLRSAPDRFEQQKKQFKQRVRDFYLERAKSEPCRIRVIDASKGIDDVKASVKQLIQRFIANG